MEPEKGKQAAGLVGWAAWGLFFVGVASLIVALAALALTGRKETVDYHAAGVCLIASALGFGLLLNGLLRR